MVLSLLGARLARGAVLLLVLGATGLPPRWRRLNGPLPSASLGDVEDFQLVPGQARVIYLADQDLDEVFELYSRSLDPQGPSIRLNDPIHFSQDVQPGFRVDPSGGYVVFGFSPGLPNGLTVPVDGSAPPENLAAGLGPPGEFSPDGERFVFLRNSGSLGSTETWLYSEPTDGSSYPLKLSGEFDPTHDVTAFEITADGRHVVFLGDQLVDERVDVYSVPIDGSAPLDQLPGRLLDGRDVTGFRLTHDGQGVVYRADQDRDEQFELFLVPVDGSATRVRVSPLLPLGRDVGSEFGISSDDAHLVFFADLESAGVPELFAVTLGASPAVAAKLNPPLQTGGSVAPGFQLSADGRWVAFLADPEADGTLELHGARLDGSTPPALLAPLQPGQGLARFELAADSVHVVFLLDGAQDELFSVPLDGSRAPLSLHPPLVAGGDVLAFELAGARVVYRADQAVDEALELFSAPADASAPAVRLHAPLTGERGVLPGFRVAADGATVGFLADLRQDERFELFVVASDGSAPPVRASEGTLGAPQPIGNVIDMAPAGERVVYRADQERHLVFELFSVPRSGRHAPTRLHPPPVEGGDVEDFVVTPDGQRVLFSGGLEDPDVREVFSAPVDGSSPAVKLNGPLVPGGSLDPPRLSADGAWTVYQADALRDEQFELFSAPVDGRTPPRRLTPAPHPNFGDVDGFVLAPDARHAVYRSDQFLRGKAELYRVALDGRAGSLKLSAIAAPGGDVHAFNVSPDSAWVVYVADQDVNDRSELYAVPLAGGVPRKLNAAFAADRDVSDFQISAGNQVLFRIGLELQSVPIDGSAPPRPVFAGPAKASAYWLTSGGKRVLVLGRRTGVLEQAFHAAPANASTPAVLLPGTEPATVNLRVLFPDEDAVIFPSRFGTFRAPLDGSQPATLIDRSGDPRELSANGRMLLISGPTFSFPNDGVYLMPSDGSAPARRVSQPVPPGGFVASATFAEDGEILYVLSPELFGPRELFVTGGDPIALPADAPTRQASRTVSAR